MPQPARGRAAPARPPQHAHLPLHALQQAVRARRRQGARRARRPLPPPAAPPFHRPASDLRRPAAAAPGAGAPRRRRRRRRRHGKRCRRRRGERRRRGVLRPVRGRHRRPASADDARHGAGADTGRRQRRQQGEHRHDGRRQHLDLPSGTCPSRWIASSLVTSSKSVHPRHFLAISSSWHGRSCLGLRILYIEKNVRILH